MNPEKRFANPRPARRSPNDCPKKSALVDALLAGAEWKPAEKPKRKIKRALAFRCPPLNECTVCNGGPCIWSKKDGGRK